jgi:pilus assembly protein CpaB
MGQLAYTIPISDVAGVGGFVRPGDVVDVILTRKIPGDGAKDDDKMSIVVLEAVPVLGIDQVSDESKTEPAVGKTATLQVDTAGAQKLALSTQLGVMTLALRNVGDQAKGLHETLTSRDVGGRRMIAQGRGSVARAYPVAAPLAGSAWPMPTPNRTPGTPSTLYNGPKMIIVRGVKTTEEGLLRGN